MLFRQGIYANHCQVDEASVSNGQCRTMGVFNASIRDGVRLKCCLCLVVIFLTEIRLPATKMSRIYHPCHGELISCWRHQVETFSALLALCTGNSPVNGGLPSQRPVTRSFDVFFNLRLNKRLSKQSSHWWFETPSRSLWRHCNVRTHHIYIYYHFFSIEMVQVVEHLSHGPLARYAKLRVCMRRECFPRHRR